MKYLWEPPLDSDLICGGKQCRVRFYASARIPAIGLNMIRRNISNATKLIEKQANKLFISPDVEYASTVWDPYQQNHINQVKRIQRKAVSYVTSNYERKAHVTEMMSKSHCQESTPELGRIDHSCSIGGSFLVILANSCEFE